MRQTNKRPKGRELGPGFTRNLFRELLEGIRSQKSLVSYLHNDLGIGWRYLSQTKLRDIPLSILMRIILNYAYLWDRQQFINAGTRLAARIYDYADRYLDEFNDPSTEDPEEDAMHNPKSTVR